jgi:hypothetical protein
MRIKFVRNDAGFDALRTSPGAQALVAGRAEALAAEANAIPSTTSPAAAEPYYEAYEAGDEHRARYRVRTTGLRASRHEAKTQALLRARAAQPLSKSN